MKSECRKENVEKKTTRNVERKIKRKIKEERILRNENKL